MYDWQVIAAIITGTVTLVAALSYIGNMILEKWQNKSPLTGTVQKLEKRLSNLESRVDSDIKVTVKDLENQQTHLEAKLDQQHREHLDRIDRLENKILNSMSKGYQR